ncbi:Zinc finger CW-type PWWP domain protein 1 [Araneus ventricosus]|uniref:Zinc finger CW-type PWWP domain protein 1 n=1 Tax=Araneus ventricosus TaxID=182803 RepID=A0A4Y2JEX4_ARAVE|nr:Zinc finger CW-type PWWP domain protein 1 [Araneus ventricosus]
MGRKRKADEAPGTSARDLLQHWNEYYMNNDFGIGIECSQCKKWRLTYQFQESKEVPTDWNCSMWKISKKKRGNCNIPSNLTEEDFAREKYPPGAMVWAKLPGFDWWPAMIEDSPDTQEFFVTLGNGVEEYHVTFFGKSPKRSWIKASHIREYAPDTSNKPSKGSSTLRKSIEQAEEAAKLPIKERLKKFSFAVRYKGRWAKLRDKDDISFPPTCSGLKGLSKPAEIKSEPTNDNRPVNGNDHLALTPHIRKRDSVSKKKVEMKRRAMEADEDNRPMNGNDHLAPMLHISKRASVPKKKVEMKRQTMDADEDQPSSCRGDNSNKIRNVVHGMKKEHVDQKDQQSSGDCRVQTAKTTVLIRRDVVGHLKCYRSYQVHEYTRRDSTKSIDNGGRREDNRPEEDGASADDEDSEDCDRKEQNVDGTRNLSVPAPPLADFDDSTISVCSSDDEEEEELPWQKAYREFIRKKYPSFLDQMFSGTAEGQMVTTA